MEFEMMKSVLMAGSLTLALISSASAQTTHAVASDADVRQRIASLESEVARLRAEIEHLHEHLTQLHERLQAAAPPPTGQSDDQAGAIGKGDASEIKALRAEALAELTDVVEDTTSIIESADHSLEGHACEHCDDCGHGHAESPKHENPQESGQKVDTSEGADPAKKGNKRRGRVLL